MLLMSDIPVINAWRQVQTAGNYLRDFLPLWFDVVHVVDVIDIVNVE